MLEALAPAVGARQLASIAISDVPDGVASATSNERTASSESGDASTRTSSPGSSTVSPLGTDDVRPADYGHDSRFPRHPQAGQLFAGRRGPWGKGHLDEVGTRGLRAA